MISTKLIETLEGQIKACEMYDDGMDNASWGSEEGVLISGNQAKEVLEIINRMVDSE